MGQKASNMDQKYWKGWWLSEAWIQIDTVVWEKKIRVWRVVGENSNRRSTLEAWTRCTGRGGHYWKHVWQSGKQQWNFICMSQKSKPRFHLLNKEWWKLLEWLREVNGTMKIKSNQMRKNIGMTIQFNSDMNMISAFSLNNIITLKVL